MDNRQVQILIYLLDEAFGDWQVKDNRNKQSLLANLKTVTRKSWFWIPENGKRSIFDIALHVGSCKYMYDNFAFGDGKLKWDDPLASPWNSSRPNLSEVIPWLVTGHNLLKSHISKLTDTDLAKDCPVNWGEMKAARWIIKVMIEHDLYHAGEINHLRSLSQKDDEWAFNKLAGKAKV